MRFAVENGMEIVEDGIYREVGPGTASYRPTLADFMKTVLVGEGQVVLVFGLDRLTRDARHLLFLNCSRTSLGGGWNTPDGWLGMSEVGSGKARELRLVLDEWMPGLWASELKEIMNKEVMNMVDDDGQVIGRERERIG